MVQYTWVRQRKIWESVLEKNSFAFQIRPQHLARHGNYDISSFLDSERCKQIKFILLGLSLEDPLVARRIRFDFARSLSLRLFDWTQHRWSSKFRKQLMAQIRTEGLKYIQVDKGKNPSISLGMAHDTEHNSPKNNKFKSNHKARNFKSLQNLVWFRN